MRVSDEELPEYLDATYSGPYANQEKLSRYERWLWETRQKCALDLRDLRAAVERMTTRNASGPSHGDPGGYGSCRIHGTTEDVTICGDCFKALNEVEDSEQERA